tara:strand:- start:144 stop:815 length:672 start_codon:yes stop_codon:yes gene_type:complete
MQKSYEGLKELLEFSNKFYLHKQLYQLGSGKKIPKEYEIPRTALLVGYDYDIIQIIKSTKIFSKVETQDSLESYNGSYNSLDFIYLNIPPNQQLEAVKGLYGYTKWFITGNNFDKKVTTDIFKHSDSLKIKFKESWMFLQEQSAWVWQDELRKDISFGINQKAIGDGSLYNRGKLFTNYNDDKRVNFNYNSKNKEFIEYYENLNYTDHIKFTNEEKTYFAISG